MAEILMKHGDRRELAKKFDVSHVTIISALKFRTHIWGIERSGFFNGREKWAKGFENQRV